MRDRMVCVALSGIAVAWACGNGRPAGEPIRVEIVEPANGAAVTGPNVRIVLSASGIAIGPAGVDSTVAHHHLFLDTDPTPAGQPIPAGEAGIVHLGKGQTEYVFEGLAPGAHRVIAVLANWVHVPLAPPVRDTVEFTVQAP